MKTYEVKMTREVTQVMYVTVHAENEKDARNAADCTDASDDQWSVDGYLGSEYAESAHEITEE